MHALRTAAVALALVAGIASAQTIDHTSIPGVASYSQQTMDQIGQLNWYFIHASVGNNILEGISGNNSLNNLDPGRYQLTKQTLSTANGLPTPPSPTQPGKIYEHLWTSGGTSAQKMANFQTAVEAGWQAPAVDVAFMKFCYLDGIYGLGSPANSVSNIANKANDYLTMMSSLEQSHSGTRFVYMTMPLLVWRPADDPYIIPNYYDSLEIINAYNDVVRAYCEQNGKLLYDIADIEAHDPNGNETTFEYHGKTLQAGYRGYFWANPDNPTSNHGHLGNVIGKRQVALGLYAIGAEIVPEPASMMLLLAGAGAVLARRRR